MFETQVYEEMTRERGHFIHIEVAAIHRGGPFSRCQITLRDSAGSESEEEDESEISIKLDRKQTQLLRLVLGDLLAEGM